MDKTTTCKNCGAKIPEGASFCPHCATVLAEKEEVRLPRRYRRRLLFFLAVLCVLAAGAAAYRHHSPETYEGAAEVVYKDKDGSYRVLLSFYSDAAATGQAGAEQSVELASGEQTALPCQLYVFDEETGEPAGSAFSEKLASCTARAVPRDGAAAMEIGGPAYNEVFPEAVCVADVSFTSESGTNEILWTLDMANGDRILLTAVVAVTEQEAVSYSPENASMDTAEELRELLAAVEEEVPASTVVYLSLPPVTYEGELTFGAHTFVISGGTDGENRTAFSGTVRMQADDGQYAQVSGVSFSGSGGTGLLAESAVYLEDCSFKGWDIGAAARDGSWVGARSCEFENNGIGLYFDSSSAVGADTGYEGNTFTGNGTAVLLDAVPGGLALDFYGSVFADNGVNLTNHSDSSVTGVEE